MAAQSINPTIADSPGYLVGRLENVLRTALDRALAPFDVTGKQLALLSLLYHNGDSTPARLADLIAIDMGAISRLLDRLEKKRLIVRKRSTDDRRSVSVQLTATGRTLHPELASKADAVIEQMLRGMDSRSLSQVSDHLKLMLQNLTSVDR